MTLTAYSSTGDTPLHLAARTGNFEAVKLLIDSNANIDCMNSVNANTALHEAAKNGHIQIVQYLVDRGAKLDIKNQLGNTALMVATLQGNLEIVSLLCNKMRPEDMNIVNETGFSALHIAGVTSSCCW